MTSIIKIVILGPESTGKSTLCNKLAAHYNTIWVPEYAREYLEKNGTEYSYADLLTIAKGEVHLEETMVNRFAQHHPKNEAPKPVFIDTDMYVMKVWSEFVFNRCDNWILNRIAERHYDMYFLCDVDLPWEEDVLREYPDKNTRNKLYRFYKELMINQRTPWHNISGNYEERLALAVHLVDELTKKTALK